METLVNAWGGEGVLSFTAVYLMGCLGLYNGILPDNQKIHINVLDLDVNSPDYKRAVRFANMYEKYYSVLYDGEPAITFDRVDLPSIVKKSSSATSAYGKFLSEDLLSLGCPKSDMRLNINTGIYGKPWLGEIFYSDTDFKRLYSTLTGGSAAIINCGGYRGGGTATTFIPLENVQAPDGLVVRRYTVVSGPATKFKTNAIIYPDIYHGLPQELRDADIFTDDMESIKTQLLKYSFDAVNRGKHEQNLAQLELAKSASTDFANLNPNFYFSRFLDRMFSDISSTVRATFVNIKTDGERILDYDITSDVYNPDLQNHMLHITNLLNALTIREIIANSDNDTYSGGKVFAFGTGSGTEFSSRTMFPRNEFFRYWQFLIMSLLTTFFIYDTLNDPKSVSETLETQSKGGITGLLRSVGRGKAASNTDNYTALVKACCENEAMAAQGTQYVQDFLRNFIYPVLIVLHEIDSTSHHKETANGAKVPFQTDMLFNIWNPFLKFTAESIISTKKAQPADQNHAAKPAHSQAYPLNNYMISTLKEFFIQFNKKCRPADNQLDKSDVEQKVRTWWTDNYMASFPKWEGDSPDKFNEYCRSVIRHAMSESKTLLEVILR